MKRPSSSSSSSTPNCSNSATTAKFLVLTLLLFLHPVMSMRAATSAAISRSSNSYGKSWRSHISHHPHPQLHHSCDPSFRREHPPHYSSSLCFHLERIRRRRHQPTPPPPPDEIDPRYGVDKRLVPSGPNPLHN